jgi:hypothetical protein
MSGSSISLTIKANDQASKIIDAVNNRMNRLLPQTDRERKATQDAQKKQTNASREQAK